MLFQVDGRTEADANFGALFRYDRFEAAFSTFYLFNDIRGNVENTLTARAFSHTTLLTSYRFPVNEQLELRPTLAYRFATVNPGQLDMLLAAEWNQQFKLALGYRSDFGVLVTAGAQISNRYYIGYGYEYGTTGFGQYARNSHEIVLRVRFGDKPAKQAVVVPQEVTRTEEAPEELTEKPAEEAKEEPAAVLEPLISEDAYKALNVPEDAYRATYQAEGYIINSINYSGSATEIPADGLEELEKIAGFLLRYPKVTMEIGAFTSSQGDANVNILTSRKRAQSIVEYLVGKGVAASRLKAIGYGPQNPRFNNDTQEGRTLNQRIEIKVLSGIE